MGTIISVEEAKTLGRPIGKVAPEKITAFIMEVENTIIRKVLGDELYSRITRGERNEDINLLLDGGDYHDKNGFFRMLTGLKTAIAYYVYAQNVRAGDYESTRYGMVVKDGDYSSGVSLKERDALANSATEVADRYVAECMEFCKERGIKTGNSVGSRITSGCVIRKIKI